MTTYANRMDKDTNCGLDDTANARPRIMETATQETMMEAIEEAQGNETILDGIKNAAVDKKSYHEINDATIAALDAIRNIKKAIDAVHMGVRNGEHINVEWWVENDAESDLYSALKNYEETIRKYKNK